MCKYASFVLTKDRVFWRDKTESHENIISEFGLCETDSTKTRINILRVEISPVKIFSDLSKWKYKVDQDLRPEWFDAAECEKRTRAALKKKIRPKLMARFRELDKFIAEIPKVKYFQPDGRPLRAWKLYTGITQVAAWNAAGEAAWNAARDAAWNAAEGAAWNAAGGAAWNAARDAARDAAGAAAGDAARAAAGDAELMARVIIVRDLLDKNHVEHTEARWRVWQKGYGLRCDINGVLYVYTVGK